MDGKGKFEHPKSGIMYDKTGVNNLCLKHIEIIFSRLVGEGLIDSRSRFFSVSKECVSKTCFQSLYPLAELFNSFSDIHFDFLLHNTYLFIYAFFLDQSLDSLENNPAKRARASQISSYLLLNYFEWLTKAYKSKLPFFNKYYKEQTNYLIVEKKWEFPQLYLSAYGSPEKIYKKEVMLLFPLELCKRDLYICDIQILKNLFINYYSFILLSDDLVDIDFDISNRCLTYPIALYFKIKGKLPECSEDIIPILPQIIESLQKFLENVRKLEISIGQHSSIINTTISNIKGELSKMEVKL